MDKATVDLHYGSTIALFSGKDNGFVSAGGYLDKSVWLESLKQKVNIPHNVPECMFEVTTRFQYSASKAVDSYLEEVRFQDRSFLETDEAYHDANLQEKLAKEAEEHEMNMLEYRRMQSQPITYGSIVQLFHRSSQSFLKVEKRVAEENKKSLRVAIDSVGGDGCWFVVMPAYRTVGDGAKVRMGDVISLHCLKYAKHGLSISPINWAKRNWQRAVPKSVVDSKEVNAGGTFARLAIVPMGKATKLEKQDCIHMNDVITFYHKDATACLHSDDGYTCKYLVKNRDDYINSNGYWRIEATELEWGAKPVEFDSVFRLRHMATGRYLACKLYTSAESEALNRQHQQRNLQSIRTDIEDDLSSVESFTDSDEESKRHLQNEKKKEEQKAKDSLASREAMKKKGAWGLVKAQSEQGEMFFRAKDAEKEPDDVEKGTLYFTDDHDSVDTLWKLIPHYTDQETQGVIKNNLMFLYHTIHGYVHEVGMIDAGAQKIHRSRLRLHRKVMLTQKVALRDLVVPLPISVESQMRLGTIVRSMQRIKDFVLRMEVIPTKWSADKKDTRVDKIRSIADERHGPVYDEMNRIIHLVVISRDPDPYTRDGIPVREVQDVMREQGALKVLLSVLTVPVKRGLGVDQDDESNLCIRHPQNRRLKAIMQLSVRLMTLFCKSHKENQMAIAPHLHHLERLATSGIHIPLLFMQVFSGNKDLVNHYVDDRMVKSFVRILSDAPKNPEYVRFLNSIVAISNSPIVNNQERVTRFFINEGDVLDRFHHQELLLEVSFSERADDVSMNGGTSLRLPDRPEDATLPDISTGTSTSYKAMKEKKSKKSHKHLLSHDTSSHELVPLSSPATAFVDRIEGSLVYIREIAQERIPLNQFFRDGDSIFQKNLEQCSHEEVLLRYHVRTVELMGNMLLGRNRIVFQTLVQRPNIGMGYKDLLHIVFHPNLPHLLRCAYCTLLERMYLDRDPYIEQTHRRVLVTAHPLGPGGAYTTSFDDIKEQRMDSLNPFCSPQFMEYRPTPRFTDLKDLCRDYIQRHTSIDASQTGRNRLTLAILDIVEMLLKHGIYTGGALDSLDMHEVAEILPGLLSMLDSSDDLPKPPGRYIFNVENSIVVDVKKKILQIIQHVMHFRMELRTSMIFNVFDWKFHRMLEQGLLQTRQEEYECILDHKEIEELVHEMFDKTLISPLISLRPGKHHGGPFVDSLLELTRYDNPDLCRMSLDILSSHLQQRAKFTMMALKVRPLVQADYVSVFHEAWLDVYELRQLCKWIPEKPRAEMMRRTGKDSYDEATLILKKMLTNLNPKRSDVDKYQMILLSVDVEVVLMLFVRLGVDVDENMNPKRQERKELIQLVLVVIKAFVHKNKEAQESMSGYILELSKMMGVKGLNIADTLIECIRDNLHMVESLDKRVSQRFVTRILDYGRQPRWLRFFDALLSVDGQMLKAQQQNVLKILLDNNLLDLKGEKEEHIGNVRVVKHRMQLLEEDEQKLPMGSSLVYHKQCIELLAKVCIGKVRSNEVKCHVLIPFNDLMTALLDELRYHKRPEDSQVPLAAGNTVEHYPSPDALRYLKAAYVRFLTYVYLETTSHECWSFVVEPNNRWFVPSLDDKLMGRLSLIAGMVEDLNKLTLRLTGTCSANVPYEAFSSDPFDIDAHIDYTVDACIGFFTEYCSTFLEYHNEAEETEDSSQLFRAQGVQLRAFDSAFAEFLGAPEIATRLTKSHLKKCIECAFVIDEKGFKRSAPIASKLSLIVEAEAAKPHHHDTDYLYQHLWEKTILSFGARIGVRDFKRNIGLGLRSFAQLMAERDEDTKHLIKFFLETRSFDDDLLTATFLRMVRAILYLDPKVDEDDAWQRFIDSGRVVAHSERWLREHQIKYARLGAAVLSAEFINHRDPYVSLAALRLCLVLLQDGNQMVQDILVDHFQTNDSKFFLGCQEKLRAMTDLIKIRKKALKEAKKKKKQKEKMNQRRASTELLSMGTGIGPKTSVDATLQALKDEEDAIPEIAGHDQPNVLEVLELLDLMCDGRNTKMQNLMRHQPESLAPVDLIHEVVEFSMGMQRDLEHALFTKDYHIFHVSTQTFLTLVKTIQGPNTKNQEAILSTKMLEVVNRMYEVLASVTGEMADCACSLRSAILSMLIGLTEGRSDRRVAERMLDQMSWGNFHFAFRHGLEQVAYYRNKRGKVDNQRLHAYIEEVNLYLFLSKTLYDYEVDIGMTSDQLCAMTLKNGCRKMGRIKGLSESNNSAEMCVGHAFETWPGAESHFKQYCARIEIFKDAQVWPLYFHTNRIGDIISQHDDMKIATLEMIESAYEGGTSTATTRMRNFSSIMINVNFILSYRTMLARIWGGGFLLWASKSIRKSALFFSILMNVILVLHSDSVGWTLFEEHYDPFHVYRPFKVLMAVHFMLSLFTTGLWLFEHGPVVIFKKMWESGKFEKVQHGGNEEWERSYTEVHMIPVIKWRLLPWYLFKLYRGKVSNYANWDTEVLYWLGYPIFSCLAMSISPLFYFYHLLDFVRDKVIRIVLRSVTQNIQKLGKTMVLGVLLIYLFAILAVVSFGEKIDNCDTMFKCFVTVFYFGFVSQPMYDNIDDLTPLPNNFFVGLEGDSNLSLHAMALIAWNVSFSFTFITLLLAIISGIIIDTFGELRKEADQIQDSMMNECFICGLKRFHLDEYGRGFEHHIHHEHNFWKYIYSFAYIERKEPSLLTGQEQHLREMFCASSVDVFPVGRAFCLQQSKDLERDVDVPLSVQTIEKKVKNIDKKVDQISEAQNARFRLLEDKLIGRMQVLEKLLTATLQEKAD